MMPYPVDIRFISFEKYHGEGVICVTINGVRYEYVLPAAWMAEVKMTLKEGPIEALKYLKKLPHTLYRYNAAGELERVETKKREVEV
ncbi:MAG: hypothetical protein IIA59_00475 [Candidatus Marinimicrobia bacterium]|nr:hypothetical protein [Candidatus Neomarinimicrobiota bacterium]